MNCSKVLLVALMSIFLLNFSEAEDRAPKTADVADLVKFSTVLLNPQLNLENWVIGKVTFKKAWEHAIIITDKKKLHLANGTTNGLPSIHGYSHAGSWGIEKALSRKANKKLKGDYELFYKIMWRNWHGNPQEGGFRTTGLYAARLRDKWDPKGSPFKDPMLTVPSDRVKLYEKTFLFFNDPKNELKSAPVETRKGIREKILASGDYLLLPVLIDGVLDKTIDEKRLGQLYWTASKVDKSAIFMWIFQEAKLSHATKVSYLKMIINDIKDKDEFAALVLGYETFATYESVIYEKQVKDLLFPAYRKLIAACAERLGIKIKLYY